MTLLVACRKEGAETTLHLLEIPNRSLSRRQTLEIRRIDPRTRIEHGRWDGFRKLAAGMAGTIDVLYLGLDGQRSRTPVSSAVWGATPERPVLVSAYPNPVPLRS